MSGKKLDTGDTSIGEEDTPKDLDGENTSLKEESIASDEAEEITVSESGYETFTQQENWKRGQYVNMIIVIIATLAVFALAGAFAPGVLTAFATVAALMVASPILPWVLLLTAGALLGLEISLLAAAGALSGRDDLGDNPKARFVLYSRLAIILGLLLGAVTLPFLAATVFPVLLTALAATAIFPAMPWLLLGLMGVGAGVVLLGIIAGVLNLGGAHNFVREFFGSLRIGAVKKLEESSESLDLGKQADVVSKPLSATTLQISKPEPQAVEIPLPDYKLGQDDTFFGALEKRLIKDFDLLTSDEKLSQNEMLTVNEANQPIASSVLMLEKFCQAAAKGGDRLTHVVAFDKALQACETAGVNMKVLEPVAEKLGQYKAAVVLEATKDPEQLVGVIKALAPVQSSGGSSSGEAKLDYSVMLANIPLKDLEEISGPVSKILAASESKSTSSTAAEDLSQVDKVKLEGLSVAIESRINQIKLLDASSGRLSSVSSS